MAHVARRQPTVRCGVKQNGVRVQGHPMVAPGRRDVKKDATGVGPVAQNHGVPRGRAVDKTPSPTHAWRSHPATPHRTIMMLVTVIPKGTSTGKRTTQPSMNSVATVDKKSPSCAEGGGSCCSCCRPDCWHGGNLKRIEIGTHTITHTQAACFSRN